MTYFCRPVNRLVNIHSFTKNPARLQSQVRKIDFMRITSLFLLIILPLTLIGQKASFYPFETNRANSNKPSLRFACDNFAGTFKLGIAAPSNKSTVTADRKHIYLCKGDSVSIIHNKDFILTGDPKPLTPAGIGYIMYKCDPKGKTGPQLSDIQTDPCLLTQASAGGTFSSQTSGLWMVKDKINGDLTFFNQGQLQTSFNSGGPVSYWFAPATLDDFDGKKYETMAGSAIAGICVNVNISEAIRVTYLNPIVIKTVSKKCLQNNCIDRFVINGGLPEINGTTYYKIEIFNKSNPNLKGKIISNGPFKNGDTLEIFVPTPGEFQITAKDDYSCDGILSANFNSCSSTTFTLPKQNAKTGDTICVPIKASRLTNAYSLDLGFSWDKTVLEFSSISTANTKLIGIGTSDIVYSPITNNIKVSYFKQGGDAFSLNDGDLLFSVCLKVIGKNETKSAISFTDIYPSPLADECGKPMGFQYSNGQINITNDILFVDVKVDSIPCQNVGSNTGGFNLTVTAGVPPYKVTWLNKDDNTTGSVNINNLEGKGNIPGLKAGNYLLTITDSAPLKNTSTKDFEIPPSRNFVVRLDIIKDIICNNDSNGELKATVLIDAQEETDLTNYNFTWSNDPTIKTSFQKDLSPSFSAYTVSVKDQFGCVAQASENLTNPSKIIITTSSLTKATCSGVADGEASISVNGGIKSSTGTYTLKWADQVASVTGSSSFRTNLLPGTYAISVTDARGCQKSAPVIIDAAKKLDFDITGIDASCLGKCDGKAIIVVASTATGTPSFNISSGLSVPTGSGINYQFSNLCSGNYMVTMLSAEAGKQCSLEKTVSINDPKLLQLDTLIFTQESCTAGGGKDGKIKVAAKGGVSPYSYLWASTSKSNLSDSSSVVNLTKGTYTVTVKDGGGCTSPFPFTITSRSPPKITELNAALVSCIGNKDGKLSVKAIAGDSPISTYTWSNSVSGQFINGLAVGTYKVTVTGSDGCSADSSVTVSNPEPFKLKDTKYFEPTCVGKADGRIVIDPVGGTPPYKITWENSTQTGSSLINISKGTYRFNLVDANNCPTYSQEIKLSDAPEILVSLSNVKEVSCYSGSLDGQATARASYSDGRQGTFDFEWSSGESQGAANSGSAFKLRSNLNSLTVTDNNLCKKIIEVNIPFPPAITANTTVKPVSCFGMGDGSIDVSPTGGRGTFTYVWNTGANSASVNGMKKGVYLVTITDGNKCEIKETITLSEPAQLLIELDATNTKNVSCPGLSDGKLVFKLKNDKDINPLGPTPYQWSTDGGISTASISKDKLPAGTYSITVTDSKGCKDETKHTFTTPDPIIAFFNPVSPPLCYGSTTTLSVKSVTGGNGTKFSDYVFSVNNSGISFPVNQNIQIFAGRTIIQVEDFLGCSYTETIDVTSPLPLLVEFNPGSINVPLGDSTTLLKPKIQTSNPIKSYKWSPASGLSSANIANPGINKLYQDQRFNLEVTDINGCKSNGNIQVLVDRNYSVFIPNVFSPNGDGYNDELRLYACLGVQEINNLKIFDRWGNLIKSINSVPVDCEGGTILWDGNYGGRTGNIGNYVYTFEVLFLDGYRRPYSGDFIIIK